MVTKKDKTTISFFPLIIDVGSRLKDPGRKKSVWEKHSGSATLITMKLFFGANQYIFSAFIRFVKPVLRNKST
jgi:hypothetical protein